MHILKTVIHSMFCMENEIKCLCAFTKRTAQKFIAKAQSALVS